MKASCCFVADGTQRSLTLTLPFFKEESGDKYAALLAVGKTVTWSQYVRKKLPQLKVREQERARPFDRPPLLRVSKERMQHTKHATHARALTPQLKACLAAAGEDAEAKVVCAARENILGWSLFGILLKPWLDVYGRDALLVITNTELKVPPPRTPI